jgi:DNA-binding transcriptional regulator LsrR (DeoR family)
VVGVGGTDDGCTMVRSGCCPLIEMARLRTAGAVGDVLGNYFDATGRLIAAGEDRIVGLTLVELRRINTVVVMASESAEKATALLGALRTGVPDVLIIDERSARLVLEGAADSPIEPRPPIDAGNPAGSRPSNETLGV